MIGHLDPEVRNHLPIMARRRRVFGIGRPLSKLPALRLAFVGFV